jgi:hypothetical protein
MFVAAGRLHLGVLNCKILPDAGHVERRGWLPQDESVGHAFGQIDPDAFCLKVFVDCDLAAFAADAALLVAAEWRQRCPRSVGEGAVRRLNHDIDVVHSAMSELPPIQRQ